MSPPEVGRKAPRPLNLSRRARLLLGAATGVLAGLVVLALRRTDLAEALELRLVDLRTRTFAGRAPFDPSIVVVTIEDADVAAVKRDLHYDWPWSLELNAAAMSVFEKARARAVLVDVLHLDRGQGSDDFASSRALTPTEQAALDLETGAAEAYGAALRGARSVVAFELTPTPRFEVPARVEVAVPRLRADGLSLPPRALSAAGADLPVRRVAAGATALGFVNVWPDLDGVVRRAHVVGRWGDRPALSLALAGASVASDASPLVREGRVEVGRASQALDDAGAFFVDFKGASKACYRRVPASKVLEWALAASDDAPLPTEAQEAFADAVVVWGVNLAGAKDLVATPMAGDFEGPVLQATIVDNLLRGHGRVRVADGIDAALLLLLGAAVGAATVGPRRRWIGGLALLVALGLVVGLAALAFEARRIVDVGAPATSACLAFAAGTVLLLRTEGRYNRWLEGAFGLYLSPKVVEALQADPSRLALGGAQRDVTVLFSDVAGFSSIARTLSAPDLVSLLNEYLTHHGEAIHAEEGTISKFIGDAVMAVYGDPLPQPDQALRACRTALDVLARLPALKGTLAALGVAKFEVRIGLNTGPAVVGNLGSRQRFDYTSMGEVVNLASRLEGANKYFGTSILAGPRTREEAGDAVVARAVARVVVVGWDAPEPVYEILGLRASAAPDLLAHVAAYERAADAMRAGDLAAAEEALAEARRCRPSDGPTAWLRGVLEAMRRGEVPSPWSGVARLEGK